MLYNHLTREDRLVIHRMRIAGQAVRAIAQALGRHPSTIYRELRRNASGPKAYSGAAAHTMYRKRRQRRVWRIRRDFGALMEYVCAKLRSHWSPEQISGRLRLDFPFTAAMRIAPITIYRLVWLDKAQGGVLHTYLRQGRKKKRKRYGSTDRRGRIVGCTLIDDRPHAVQAQRRFGDWEADTVWGCTKKAYVATFVERKSLYVIARKMPDRSADSLNRAAVTGFRHIPKRLRRTLTVDHGKEFCGFETLAKRLAIDVYFAHPYAAWERGTNENLNGLLRQYIPKKTDIDHYSPQQLAHYVNQLNNRPRKKLGYRTPAEVFLPQCSRT